MTLCKEALLVLVVEDDPDIREIMLLVLESLNCRATAAENGAQALEFLRSSKELPALIFLDLMMPVMNGWDLLKAMEQDATLSRLPVVILSAIADDTALSANVVARLQKPASCEQLAAVIARNTSALNGN